MFFEKTKNIKYLIFQNEKHKIFQYSLEDYLIKNYFRFASFAR